MTSNVDQSVLAVPSTQLKEAYFEMCFHMGIVQIALDPPSPLSNGQTWKKSAPNHPGKPSHPLLLSGNAHVETAHLKKVLP